MKNDRIGRSVIMSADDLKAKAIGALRRLQKLPGIVRGFLRDPKLAYILELHPGTAHGVYKGISSLVKEEGTGGDGIRPCCRESSRLSARGPSLGQAGQPRATVG